MQSTHFSDFLTNRLFLATCLALMACATCPAGAQQYLRLHYDCKKPAVGFARVQVLDHRMKGQLLGYVQKGAFNRLEGIDFKGSLADSLARFFQPEGAAARADRELALILEDLFLSEQTNAFSEDGKLKLSVRLFVKNDAGRFEPLFTVDSTYYTAGLDVTQKMLRSVSDRFCALATAADSRVPQAGTSYTLEELGHLDSLELLSIPVFTGKPQRGIYRTYQSFEMNTPDVPAALVVETAPDGHTSVYQTDTTRKGKVKKTYVQKSSAIYAVSDGEQLVKYFEDGWYPIFRTGTGFYFDSKTAFSNNAAMWGGAIGGIAGMVVAQRIDAKTRKMYRFRINHRTGRPVPVMIVE